jgi:hypothetical protein
LLPGPYHLTVFVNGIPSLSPFMNVTQQYHLYMPVAIRN